MAEPTEAHLDALIRAEKAEAERDAARAERDAANVFWVDKLNRAEAERDELKSAWEKDNLCGICPYRRSIQARAEKAEAFVRAYDRWQVGKGAADQTGDWLAIAPLYDNMLAAREALTDQGGQG